MKRRISMRGLDAEAPCRHGVTGPCRTCGTSGKVRCLDDSVSGGCQRGKGHDGGHCAYDIDDAPGMRESGSAPAAAPLTLVVDSVPRSLRIVKCPQCDGSGSETGPNDPGFACPRCGGAGEIYNPDILAMAEDFNRQRVSLGKINASLREALARAEQRELAALAELDEAWHDAANIADEFASPQARIIASEIRAAGERARSRAKETE